MSIESHHWYFIRNIASLPRPTPRNFTCTSRVHSMRTGATWSLFLFSRTCCLARTKWSFYVTFQCTIMRCATNLDDLRGRSLDTNLIEVQVQQDDGAVLKKKSQFDRGWVRSLQMEMKCEKDGFRKHFQWFPPKCNLRGFGNNLNTYRWFIYFFLIVQFLLVFLSWMYLFLRFCYDDRNYTLLATIL